MIEIIIIIICIVNTSQQHVCGWLSCLGQCPHHTAQARPQIRSNEKWPPHLRPAALRPLFTLVCPAVPSPQSTLSCMYTYLLKMPPGNQVSFVCHHKKCPSTKWVRSWHNVSLAHCCVYVWVGQLTSPSCAFWVNPTWVVGTCAPQHSPFWMNSPPPVRDDSRGEFKILFFLSRSFINAKLLFSFGDSWQRYKSTSWERQYVFLDPLITVLIYLPFQNLKQENKSGVNFNKEPPVRSEFNSCNCESIALTSSQKLARALTWKHRLNKASAGRIQKTFLLLYHFTFRNFFPIHIIQITKRVGQPPCCYVATHFFFYPKSFAYQESDICPQRCTSAELKMIVVEGHKCTQPAPEPHWRVARDLWGVEDTPTHQPSNINSKTKMITNSSFTHKEVYLQIPFHTWERRKA